MRRIAQATSWILLFSIAALSVVPPDLRPVTILPHDMEHAALYFLAGCEFGLVYADHFVTTLVGLSAFNLVMEVIQLWIPGRHARMSDFLVDAFAIAVGLVGGAALARRLA
jgi:VanZ family protein